MIKYFTTLLFSVNFCILGFSQDFVKQSLKTDDAPSSEEYQSMTFNGAWCWFSDPRAVYYEGNYKRTYSGWVDNFGDIHIGYYDHETKQIRSKVIYDSLEIDDHNNPSILFDEMGHLLVFFNKHGGGMYFTRSTKPEDVKNWSTVRKLELNDTKRYDFGRDGYTYTNPIKLSAENGRIFLFWRGIDGKPTYSISDNNGKTWSKGVIFFMPERIYGFRRPYVKYYSDGESKIHIALTDGHPRKETTNSIYYMYYENGAFYRATGEKIRDMDEDAHQPADCDKVYDATATEHKAWIWDIAADEEGNPVLAYTKFPDDKNHIYSYARWDGKKWRNYDLVNSGSWFPQTMEDQKEFEPNYSGGLNIDHENTSTVYLSVNRDSIFEIEKWTTKNGGKSWKAERITHGSSKDNIRPFAVRGATEGNPVQVLWMQNTKYIRYAFDQRLVHMGGTFKDRFHTAIKINVENPPVTDFLEKDGIVKIMRRTADWQFENPRFRINPLDWHYGALYTGVRALYEITGENRYRNELYNIGQANHWQPMDDIFHADRLTVIDTWAWLYEQKKQSIIIDKSKWALDIHLARRYKQATDVSFDGNPYRFEWWTWCDALFMAPPSFVNMWKVTGDEDYLEYMDTQWWKTSDYLYSKEDSLYYRDDRFFDKRTDNDKKVFWSRGNGWVIAGLARILSLLPDDYDNRAAFEQQYKEMAHKLLSIQGEDGLWRVSLHDPEYLDIGESSGSSFYTFALAWGLNNGMLEGKYRSNVEKAWRALCGNVNMEGRLGYVQQVAGDPYPFYKHEWHVYATGAFLLAGKEMYQLTNE